MIPRHVKNAHTHTHTYVHPVTAESLITDSRTRCVTGTRWGTRWAPAVPRLPSLPSRVTRCALLDFCQNAAPATTTHLAVSRVPEPSAKHNTVALPVVSAGSGKWPGPWLAEIVRAVLTPEALPAFTGHDHHWGFPAASGADGPNPLLIG